eukprot:2331688-Karenia_brevis.AAC.1
MFGWSPDNGKGGFQGLCWKCGIKGHKSWECPNGAMIQGVEAQQGDWVDKPTVSVGSGVAKETCSVEKGWWIGS